MADTHTTPRVQGRRRLRRAGKPGADPVDWLARASLACFAAAAVWLVVVTVRPLPVPEEDSAGTSVVALPKPRPEPQTLAQRRALIEALSARNIWTSDGIAWSGTPAADTHAQAAPGEQQGGQRPAGQAGADAPTPTTGTIALTPASRVPDDVKRALQALELRGVRIDAEGEPVAMISRIHGSSRQASVGYRSGDEFEEEQNKQAKWRVEAVDWEHRRAILSRSGATVELPLYRGALASERRADAAVVPVAVSPGGRVATRPRVRDTDRVGLPGAPAVALQSREQALAKLREAGIGEDELAALAGLMDEPIDESLAKIPERPEDGDAEGVEPARRRAPPPGMESILRLMAEQAKEQGNSANNESPRRRQQ